MSEIVERLVEPWSSFHGELPEYDHPLRCVYESGIQYAVELLAKELGVAEWDVCDGTEEFDGDLGGTMMNIVCEALPKDKHGDRMWPSQVTDLIEQQAREIARLREAMEEIRDLTGEINPSNYDHDDACFLNSQFCYAGSIAESALKELKP